MILAMLLLSALVAAEAPQGYPADLPSLVDVRDPAYGAVGDGMSDDTAALHKAMTVAVGRNGIIYFPPGIYLVREALDCRRFNAGVACYVTFAGAGPERSIIRLADACPGFGDQQRPKAVIRTASKDGGEGGNTAFGVFIERLAIETGRGNPGAIGIDYVAHNYGAMERVRIASGDGQGFCGLGLRLPDPGPCLIHDVTIEGFAYGVDTGMTHNYGVTLLGLRLTGQTVAGIRNQRNGLFLEDFVSRNAVPALLAEGPGLTSMVHARLLGGATSSALVAGPAAAIYLRDVRSEGYDALVAGSTAMAVQELAIPRAIGTTRSLHLPVELPRFSADFESREWADIRDFGAVANDDRDDADAIQRALDSGHPAVALPCVHKEGRKGAMWQLSRTVIVPPGVRLVDGFNADVAALPGGPFDQADVPRPLFRSSEPGESLEFRRLHLNPWWTPAKGFQLAIGGPRSLILRHASTDYRSEPGQGDLVLVDVQGSSYQFLHPMRVSAWQLDAETARGSHIVNRGATVRILGLKTERPGVISETRAGGSTEMLGANCYMNFPVGPRANLWMLKEMAPLDETLHVVREGSATLVFMTTASRVEGARSTVLDAICGGHLTLLRRQDVPARNELASLVPLLNIGVAP